MLSPDKCHNSHASLQYVVCCHRVQSQTDLTELPLSISRLLLKCLNIN